MKYYHITNGKIYCCPDHIETLEEYKQWVKDAYGNLKGVRFVQAENRDAALFAKSL